MGGSKELDVLENVITLSSVIHRTYLHPGVSVPTIRIVHWDPSDPANGLQVERRDGADDEWMPYPKMDLWFYRRPIAENVMECLDGMHRIQNLTGFHAMTMYSLRLVWRDLYPDASSFDQIVSGLGWDPGDANDIADKHEWLLVNGCAWPEGLTDRQLRDIIDYAAPPTLFDEEDAGEPTRDMQTMLLTAAGKSYSDVKQAMIDKKLRHAQPYYFLIMASWLLPLRGDDGHDDLFSPKITVVQTRDEQGMKRAIRAGEICEDIDHPIVFRMGKAVMGVDAKRNLFALKSGEKIEVIHWPETSADHLASVLSAYKEEADDAQQDDCAA